MSAPVRPLQARPGPAETWGQAALERFERALRAERNRSPHTVRAYLADVRALLDHADRMQRRDVAQIDLAVLRSWLARQQSTGAARTSLARRASAARTFTAWATREGLLARDPGPLLASPRSTRALPDVLSAAQVRQLLAPEARDARPHAGPDEEPSAVERAVSLRDAALLELLYATGIRVSELCGADLEDVDDGRRLLRVVGKGDKQRVTPFGVPAARALERWRQAGRPVLAGRDSGRALLLGERGGGSTPASRAAS